MENKNKNGFSLIEIIISVAIFVVILTLVIVNYNHGGYSNIFRLQAFDIEDSIRSVQNMALTGKKINGKPPSAYGIFLDKDDSEIIIYGDKDQDSLFTITDGDPFSKNTLNEDITFNHYNVFCGNSQTDFDTLNIVFIPPNPIMLINDNEHEMNCQSVIIPIESTKIGGTWNIHFDAVSGRTWTEFVNP